VPVGLPSKSWSFVGSDITVTLKAQRLLPDESGMVTVYVES
jgi:hypothetical protein